MIPYERQQKILEIIENKEIVKIDQLQELISGVSISTLRRDLKELEKARKIEALSGGAVKLNSTVREIPISQKSILNSDKKAKIAKIASREIADGDVIYLDSGSTCSALFEKIFDRRITIYTTNTDILAFREPIAAKIILLGGEYNPKTSSLKGSLTEENLDNLYFDKAFLGINGLSKASGGTTPTLAEAVKKRIVKEHSNHLFLLCDSSKFHKTSNVKAFDLKHLTVISDRFDSTINDIVTLKVK
ncbi:DeoR/GlpR family DNA-binding transcription regulator [Streptococcus ratti]|uniref:DeoR/GlpR transcriptional regulator n=2 Tax=Streptococcus ratti TaxID=1341 RepID=A0A7X9LFC0_STRRT|nr:DeoR/GlpR family DNA-binding transcription regulator [Streptococcus ratti]VEI60721.1 sugar metabolism transcriptional regulator [Streptococcus mutans]EJN94437.1 transcriptional regulator [Streptococcus ratti FA-1 = DSM 20564]EMP70424.1 transcriptional regulator [Streptococcus ratti FA-1 = DSM 20564]NMD48815.1 DeoR/GlpR transcriptional regulator [Streptococcus ratti]QEY06377.1 DeoR/GlpR transcriptional regulator [Streptococcus ratti]